MQWKPSFFWLAVFAIAVWLVFFAPILIIVGRH